MLCPSNFATQQIHVPSWTWLAKHFAALFNFGAHGICVCDFHSSIKNISVFLYHWLMTLVNQALMSIGWNGAALKFALRRSSPMRSQPHRQLAATPCTPRAHDCRHIRSSCFKRRQLLESSLKAGRASGSSAPAASHADLHKGIIIIIIIIIITKGVFSLGESLESPKSKVSRISRLWSHSAWLSFSGGLCRVSEILHLFSEHPLIRSKPAGSNLDRMNSEKARASLAHTHTNTPQPNMLMTGAELGLMKCNWATDPRSRNVIFKDWTWLLKVLEDWLNPDSNRGVSLGNHQPPITLSHFSKAPSSHCLCHGCHFMWFCAILRFLGLWSHRQSLSRSCFNALKTPTQRGMKHNIFDSSPCKFAGQDSSQPLFLILLYSPNIFT